MVLYYTRVIPFTAVHIGPKTQFLTALSGKAGCKLIDLFPTEDVRRQWLAGPDQRMIDDYRNLIQNELEQREEEQSIMFYGTPLSAKQADILSEITPLNFALKISVSSQFWMSPRDWPHSRDWNNQFRDMRIGLKKRLEEMQEQYDTMFDPITEYYQQKDLLIEISEEEIRQDRMENFDASFYVDKRGVLGKKDCIVNAIERKIGPLTEEISFISEEGKRLIKERERLEAEERERQEEQLRALNAPF